MTVCTHDRPKLFHAHDWVLMTDQNCSTFTTQYSWQTKIVQCLRLCTHDRPKLFHVYDWVLMTKTVPRLWLYAHERPRLFHVYDRVLITDLDCSMSTTLYSWQTKPVQFLWLCINSRPGLFHVYDYVLMTGQHYSCLRLCNDKTKVVPCLRLCNHHRPRLFPLKDSVLIDQGCSMFSWWRLAQYSSTPNSRTNEMPTYTSFL